MTTSTDPDPKKPMRGIANTYSYGIAIGIALAIGGFEMAWNVHARNTAMRMDGITLTLDANGCAPGALKMPPGAATFNIVNATAQPLDWQILDGTTVVAGQSAIAPGKAASVAQTLQPGDYQMICGSAAAPRGAIEVIQPRVMRG
ncbi:hypothetical protein CKO11_11505 [Rhodobacter sp. TJ_12]|uniref:cupredoxin domain-containing protein n=1 Tax=Rhodobacter sp. TJ_12 TaxID=2029399 RepID=UPI001CC0C272|nr:cupredoxin domain-containing protein [Rhodobacter sp. TJ_12]MBZ4023085.1 hypothetical protein [Rhodobacter sp. TJ_12]